MYAEPLAWLTSPQRTNTGRTSTWSRWRPSPLVPCEWSGSAPTGLLWNTHGLWESSGPRTLLVSVGIFIGSYSHRRRQRLTAACNWVPQWIFPPRNKVTHNSSYNCLQRSNISRHRSVFLLWFLHWTCQGKLYDKRQLCKTSKRHVWLYKMFIHRSK